MAAVFPDYKTITVDSLIPYACNARTHSDEQVSQIAASISVPPRMTEAVARAVIEQWLKPGG